MANWSGGWHGVRHASLFVLGRLVLRPVLRYSGGMKLGRFGALLVGFVMAGASSAAQLIPPAPPNPFTVRSASGRTTLWVNPTEPNLLFPANCTAKRDGKVLWKKRFPFTFEAVGISDSGIAGGYGYMTGGDGETRVVAAITDSTGKLRVVKTLNFNQEQIPDSRQSPAWQGLLFDPDHDRMITRVEGLKTGDGLESWWVYSLSKATQIGTILPRVDGDQTGVFVTGAKLVKGTDLILASWQRYDSQTEKIGQFFTLVDSSSKIVWQFDLPGDFDKDFSEREGSRLLTEMRTGGSLLDVSQPGRFEIRSIKGRSRITYEVKRTGVHWKVTEVKRQPFVSAVKKIAATVSISASVDMSSAIRDVADFQLWGDKIVFLRNGKTPSVCVVDMKGNLIREIRMPKGSNSSSRDFLAKTGGAHFVLLSSASGANTQSYAWNIDVSTGKVTPLDKFKSPWIKSVAGHSDGSFAVTSMETLKFSATDHLSLYGPDGRLMWMDGESGYSGGPEELLSPEGVAIDANGHVVVLDVIRHTLQTFGADGKFVRSINLDKSVGRKLSYPTQITCLPDGNFWLVDMAENGCFHLDRNGKVLGNFAAKFANGRKIDVHDSIRVDGLLRPWISTESGFCRLDAKGVVAETVGRRQRRGGLGRISQIHVGADGRIYAVDSETSGVHVFDRKGHSLFVCQPTPKEFKSGQAILIITLSSDIYLSGGEAAGFLHFSPSGKRLGYVPGCDGEGPEVPIRPQLDWRWMGIHLVNERGKSVARLRRFPDQSWMEGPSAVAPDGQLVAIEELSYFGPKNVPRKIAFYSATGQAQSQALLPAEMPDTYGTAYDGERCYFTTEKGLLATNRNGKIIWRYQPAGWSLSWSVFATKFGIALYDRDHTVRWVDVK